MDEEKKDLKPSYRKNIYFSEEELEMLKTFEKAIFKDKQLKDVGKGLNKFSAVIKILMKNYIKQKSDENA